MAIEPRSPEAMEKQAALKAMDTPLWDQLYAAALSISGRDWPIQTGTQVCARAANLADIAYAYKAKRRAGNG